MSHRILGPASTFVKTVSAYTLRREFAEFSISGFDVEERTMPQLGAVRAFHGSRRVFHWRARRIDVARHLNRRQQDSGSSGVSRVLGSMDEKRKPNILWAQVSDKVFLTLDLQEAEKPKVQLINDEKEHGKIIFKYVT